MVAEQPDCDYSIKDEEKLKTVAAIYDIKTDGREIKEIAGDVARAALEECNGEPAEAIIKLMSR